MLYNIRCDRSQDSRSQVHPQPRIRRFNQNRVPGFRKERVQAALSVLEITFKRPDPCLEQARSVSGRPQCPGYQFKNLRCQPLHEAQLLDRLLRRGRSRKPSWLVGVEAPGEAVISLTAEKFTFELEQVPAAAADLRLVVCASAPQGNGITRAYSKTAVIGGPFAVEATEIDIKAAYETKNGAPTAAAPKVFMKYFLVNTKTGEKSGEMMAIARL